jgi:hypothetical protein
MAEDHAKFCTNHADGICRADDLDAGKWEIGLSDDGTGPTIYLAHPEILPAVERGAMDPEDAVALGRALVLQGRRGLRSRSDREQPKALRSLLGEPLGA